MSGWHWVGNITLVHQVGVKTNECENMKEDHFPPLRDLKACFCICNHLVSPVHTSHVLIIFNNALGFDLVFVGYIFWGIDSGQDNNHSRLLTVGESYCLQKDLTLSFNTFSLRTRGRPFRMESSNRANTQLPQFQEWMRAREILFTEQFMTLAKSIYVYA